MNKEMIIAEPLYILLAAHNHPDAHEVVRELTIKSQKTGKKLRDLVGGKQVTLIPKARSYDRVVAAVRVNRKLVSKRMRR